MITTVTLNVAIDKAYIMDDLRKGEVLRVKECNYTAGGKGLNVAKVVKLCGEEVLTTGFVGGFAGKYVEKLLEEQNIQSDFVYFEGETRSCINILESDRTSTEILEPGAILEKDHVELFMKKFSEIVDRSSIITISGSVPRGVKVDIYREMVNIVKAKGKMVLLDTSGKLLEEGIKACPTMIKPNADEIKMLLGVSTDNMDQIIQGMKKLRARGIANVAVSLGAEGALLVTDEGVFLGRPPKIIPINTVGCGDAMVAAFAVGLERKYTVEEMLRYAIAVASANALTLATGSFKMNDMKKIIKEVVVEKLE
ncbi:MAG: 1-phosphofructokinase [Clostridia bacterium]|jgi:tagatose 6-phosphate kinase|nr:1-phosphofructokinase [Clostridia bacterium]